MKPRHRVSRTAIELIKRFEGYRERAAQLPDGRWTIGHGHTLTARQGAVVSRDDAEALLLYDLIAVAHALNEQVFAPLGANQFDALASFAFNIGVDRFSQSGVLKRLNEGAPLLAACAMEQWRKAEVGGERIVVDALVRRRAAEKALFLTPDDQVWAPAPTPVLRPLVDTDAFDLIPLQDPSQVRVDNDGETVVVTREGGPLLQPSGPDAGAFEGDDGPARAAAEAVTARLSTLFLEQPGEATEIVFADTVADLAAPPAAGEALGREDSVEAVEGPPDPVALEEPDAEAEEFAEPSIEVADSVDSLPVESSGALASDSGAEAATTSETESQAAPSPVELPTESIEEPESETSTDEFGFAFDDADRPPIPERRVIDDGAPFDLDEQDAETLPGEPPAGALAVAALAAMGLVFFGGGIFWLVNARPVAASTPLDPRIVGLLASIAGALFISVAVYFLLQRLGRASERAARTAV